MSCEKLRSHHHHHHHHRQHHLLWVCLFLPPPPGPSPKGIHVLDSVVKLHKTKKSMKQVIKRYLVINHTHTHTLPFTDVKPTKSLGNKICDHGFHGSSSRKHHNNNYVIITICNFSHQLGKQSTNLPSPKVIVQVLIWPKTSKRIAQSVTLHDKGGAMMMEHLPWNGTNKETTSPRLSSPPSSHSFPQSS